MNNPSKKIVLPIISFDKQGNAITKNMTYDVELIGKCNIRAWEDTGKASGWSCLYTGLKPITKDGEYLLVNLPKEELERRLSEKGVIVFV